MKEVSNQMYVQQVKEAASVIKDFFKEVPKIGVVLGSGLSTFVDHLADTKVLPFKDVPHMPVPQVSGHNGEFVTGLALGVPVLCLAGRSHSYEGKAMHQLVFSVHVLKALGVQYYIASNAAGGAIEGMSPGAIMMLLDHFNHIHRNCLYGLEQVPGYCDPTSQRIYSPTLHDLARRAAGELSITLHEGVYASFCGPTYETPSEIRSMRALGVGAFGMSTTPGATAAAQCGLDVLALSLCTNLAAGISATDLNHEEVKEVAAVAGPRFVSLVKQIIKHIHSLPPTNPPIHSEESSFPSISLPPPSPPPPSPTMVADLASQVMKALSITVDSLSSLVLVWNYPTFPITPHNTLSFDHLTLPFPFFSPSQVQLLLLSPAQLVLVDSRAAGPSPSEATLITLLLHYLGIRHSVGYIQVYPMGGKADWDRVGLRDMTLSNSLFPIAQQCPGILSTPLLSPVSPTLISHEASYISHISPLLPTPAEQRLGTALGCEVMGRFPLSYFSCFCSLGGTSRVIGYREHTLGKEGITNLLSTPILPTLKVPIIPLEAYQVHYTLPQPVHQGRKERILAAVEEISRQVDGPLHKVLFLNGVKLPSQWIDDALLVHNDPPAYYTKGTLVWPSLPPIYQGAPLGILSERVRISGLLSIPKAFVLTGGYIPSGEVCMVVDDHINVTGRSPLTGQSEWGDRFIDQSHVYETDLVGLPTGTALFILGPIRPTSAILSQWLQSTATDMVVCSGVPDAIVSTHHNMKVGHVVFNGWDVEVDVDRWIKA